MKKLSTYLFLIFFSFQTSSWADDIRDFQIEGMSIGDSLLDYITKQEIESKKKTDYKSKKFSRTYFSLSEFEIYDSLQVHFKTSDKKYKIYNISGIIVFENNIENCYKKKDEIVIELSNFFEDVIVDDDGIQNHPDDETGESKTNTVYFDFKSGDTAKVGCVKWGKSIKSKNKEIVDNLRVTINTKEYTYWLTNEAY
jgi:hypothetical protein